MKIKYSRTIVMAVMGIFSVLLFALALAQSVDATTIGTNLSTDGTLTVNGNSTLGNATSDTLTIQGNTTITTTGTDLLNILTGNLKVGNAAPSIAQDGEDAFIEGTLEVTGSTTFGFNGAEQISVASDLAGSVNMISIVGTPSSSAGTTKGIYIAQADSANGNGLDTGLEINNLDTNLAMTAGISILSNGGGAITTAIDLSDTDIVTDLKLQNADTIDNNTDGQFMFGRDDTGIVTITAKDNNADAALTVTPGGAAALTLGTTGAGNTTSITLATDSTGDGEVVLPTDSISTGEITDNTITATDLSATVTFADADFVDLSAILHDDATTQGLRLPNVGAAPTDITGGNEGYIAWDQTGNRLLINTGTTWDPIGQSSSITDGVTDAFDMQETANNYININTSNGSEAMQFGNATTNPSFAFLGTGSVTTTGSLITRAATDITTGAASNEALTLTADGTGDITLSGDADTDVIFSGLTNDITTTGNEALTIIPAGSGDTVFSLDADTNIQVTASAAPTVDMIAITNTGQPSATGGVDGLAMLFSASNASGDAIHITPAYAGGATDTLTYNVMEADAFSPTNDAGTDTVNGLVFGTLTDPGATITSNAINIGAGWDTDIKFVDAAPIIAMPDAATLSFTDGTNNIVQIVDGNPGSITIGTSAALSSTGSINLTTDGTGDAELVVPNESVSAAEILNVTRSVAIPITSFNNVSSGGLPLDASGADAHPDFALADNHIFIQYDATGGSPDVSYIGTTFFVPQDWASGGTFAVLLYQSAATESNQESIDLEIIEQPTAAGHKGSGDETSNSPVGITNNVSNQVLTFSRAPTGAGNVIQVRLAQGNPTPDDAVNILGVEFRYTATQ